MKVLRFDKRGLMPTVIQDEASKQVLTLCYLNQEALKKSLATGTVHLFRRSQKQLMQKGQTSGHIQLIKQVLIDCDGKSMVFLIQQHVAACHAGYFTCYFRRLSKQGAVETVGERVFDPSTVY
ncbi:MAG: phosphoribosyl-AMP cyclohydrolase [Candidatus Omnitrophica bacterium]|nr:phosphoribosyl-AMP cyclohydrolase [Candidatus Omnitrophota bacterium]